MKLLFLLLISASLAFAQDTQEDLLLEQEAGVSSDSPFYFLDVLFDNLRVTLTPNPVQKAVVRLDIANERLAEAIELNGQGKDNSIVLANYNNELSEIENIQLSDEQRLGIQQEVTKHLVVLERVLAKAPEQAKTGLQNAIENSKKHIDIIENKIPETKRIIESDMRQSARATNNTNRLYSFYGG